MSIYLAEIDDIYFPKTKEYFKEVLSSYSIGNYRSATVMLYSVAICDILFKLQELKDMFNDTIASQILDEVDKSRNSHDNKSKSRWEKEFIDNVYTKTKLLDLEAYTNLSHLYDHRNFSAHPALNENYELIAPSKETTIANIKNVLNNILVKPPIFIKNVINALTEDLKEKKDLFKDAYETLSNYLENKYFSKMPISMKLATIKALWKFCFCSPENEDCKQNLVINRKALEILITGFEKETVAYIKENKNLFSVASSDDNCVLNLVLLLSRHPFIYNELNEETQLQVDTKIKKDDRAKSVSWFKHKTAREHFDYLKTIPDIELDPLAITLMNVHYSDNGDMYQLLDFFIWYYGNSGSYDSADTRFELVIEPFLHDMSYSHFEQIIKVTNSNRQIWDRYLAYTANNKIMTVAKKFLKDDFDYSEYPLFQFNPKILHSVPNTENNETTDLDDELPF